MKLLPPELSIWVDNPDVRVGGKAFTDEETRFLHWIRKLPKTELHFHAEGALPESFAAPNIQIGTSSAYVDFFARWFATIKTLSEQPRRFTDAARSIVSGLRRAGVVWAEVFISPPDYEEISNGRVKFQDVLLRWIEAFSASSDPALAIRIVVDLVRIYSARDAMRRLECLLEIRATYASDLIVGIGFGGPQNSRPLTEFEPIIRVAKEQGLLCVAHAGEIGSASDVTDAVALGFDRIGHAVGLRDAPSSYQQVLVNHTPIECCPTSSLCTGAVKELCEHPIRRWVDDGAIVTVGTDDPAMFRTELSLEYLLLKRAFGWGPERFVTLLADGFLASRMNKMDSARYINVLRASEGW